MSTETIMRVDDVKVVITRTTPHLHIDASGTVNTGGWTDAELFHNFHGLAIVDGVYEFTFLAKRPEGPVTQVLSPIKATYTAEDVPSDLKVVKVIAAENSLLAQPEFPE